MSCFNYNSKTTGQLQLLYKFVSNQERVSFISNLSHPTPQNNATPQKPVHVTNLLKIFHRSPFPATGALNDSPFTHSTVTHQLSEVLKKKLCHLPSSQISQKLIHTYRKNPTIQCFQGQQGKPYEHFTLLCEVWESF